MADPGEGHPVRAWPSHVWGNFADTTLAKLLAIKFEGTLITRELRDITASSMRSSDHARARIILCKGTAWNTHEMTIDDLECWFDIVSFPPDPLRRFNYMDNLGIEHQVDHDHAGKVVACSLLLRFEVTEQRAFCGFFHHNLVTDKHDILIFAGDMWYEMLEKRLAETSNPLGQTPYLLIATLIQSAAFRISNMRQAANTNLNEIEMALGASNNIDHLKAIGLKPASMALGDMNKALVSVQTDISDVIEEATALIRLTEEILIVFREAYGPRSHTGSTRHTNPYTVLEPELRSLTRHIHTIKTVNSSTQRRLDSLFAVLLNRINRNDAHLTFQMAKAAKKDSTAMRTISILTLVYLPGTFVCAVFSTTFFNFQNWNDSEAIASGGWWVFLAVCVLFTAFTILVWLIWTRKENQRIAAELRMMDDTRLDMFGDRAGHSHDRSHSDAGASAKIIDRGGDEEDDTSCRDVRHHSDVEFGRIKSHGKRTATTQRGSVGQRALNMLERRTR